MLSLPVFLIHLVPISIEITCTYILSIHHLLTYLFYFSYMLFLSFTSSRFGHKASISSINITVGDCCNASVNIFRNFFYNNNISVKTIHFFNYFSLILFYFVVLIIYFLFSFTKIFTYNFRPIDDNTMSMGFMGYSSCN